MKRALSKLPFACGLEMKLHLSLSGSSKYKAALLYSHHSVVKSSKVFKKYSVHGASKMSLCSQESKRTYNVIRLRLLLLSIEERKSTINYNYRDLNISFGNNSRFNTWE